MKICTGKIPSFNEDDCWWGRIGMRKIPAPCCSLVYSSDVKSLRPKLPRGPTWPRGQNFCLGLQDLASASKLWPQPQTFGLGLASILSSYYVIGRFSGKNRVKFGNFVEFSGNNLKSYVVNHYLVLFCNYYWPRPWPRPHSSGLGLEVLASFNITGLFTDV